MTEPVTIMQRMKAQAIVKKLRDQDDLDVVAAKLGIQPLYVSFAEGMYKRSRTSDELKYSCPNWAVRKILEWESGRSP